MIHVQKLLNSFTHALHGMRVVFEQEHSFRVQIVVSIVTLILAGYYPLKISEVIIVLLLIGAVLALEMLNSVLERMIDAFKPRMHPLVKEVKDIMAGAVLVVSFTAFGAGLLIFGPHLLWSFSRFWIY